MRTEVHIFGGQGSSRLFDNDSLAVVRQDARSCDAAQQLLTNCHTSLIKDCVHIASYDETLLQYIQSFPRPTSLLSPPVSLQRSPAIQAAALCLYQLLRFLANTVKQTSYETHRETIQETLGFSSGILPAVVIAAAHDTASFIKYGVQAFRSAFFIGYHAGLYSQIHYEGELPSLYAITGLSFEQIHPVVVQFNKTSKTAVTIASIIRPTHLTICGPKSLLEELILQLDTKVQSRPVQVDALYHGGVQLQPVVERVLLDLQKLNVVLPCIGELSIGVRDPLDGTVLSAKTVEATNGTLDLSRWIVEGLLVKPTNWPVALRSLSVSLAEFQYCQGNPINVLSYGPFTSLLTTDLKDSPEVVLKKIDVSHENLDIQLSANYGARKTDIAIVGVGFEFPNGSNLDQFWQSLLDGRDFVQEVPPDRFSRQQTGLLSKDAPHHGNFIKNPWAFDNALFGISPREARAMDPQQRLLLQCSYHALEHAGYIPNSTKSFQQETMGCFIGVATGDYAESAKEDLDVYHSTGTLRAFLSGRLSYFFSMSGPSMVIDTACSSSLVAIHQACEALNAGDCSSALAGGVNVICGPEMHAGLFRSHLLSPTGQCRPFDAHADGYCRAEGCGVFVLKRLSDAVAENDRILGVIKGTGINQSGTAHSITHPHDQTQIQLMERVIKNSGVFPYTIGAVEAHGTGTQAGDPAEFTSISAVLSKDRARGGPLLISSLKGNIGHAEAASGCAGLIKLLLMLSKGVVPYQVGFQSLNPKIAPLIHDGIKIPLENTDWPRIADLPRRGLLNNFGAGGSNACLIVEEYTPPGRMAEEETSIPYVFALSAKDMHTFNIKRAAMIDYLQLGDHRIQDVSYTSLRTPLLETRLIVVIKTITQLLQVLNDAEIQPIEALRYQKNPKVVLVFSGQGGHHMGMAKGLFHTSEPFRNDILKCNEILENLGFPSLLPVILNSEGSFADQELAAAHCAAFAVQYALTRHWLSWGVCIDGIIGHSLGEFAAFVAAGVLCLEDAVSLLANRALLISHTCSPGTSTMVAVNMGFERLRDLLPDIRKISITATVACDNSPSDCVVSCSSSELAPLLGLFRSRNIKCKRLDVPIGYHSPLLEPIREELDQIASKVRLTGPSVSLGLSFTGEICKPGIIPFDSSYFSNQTISPVRFRQAVESYADSLENDSRIIFLEIGPHPSLMPMAKSSMRSHSCEAAYLASLHRTKENRQSLADTAAQLALEGAAVNCPKWFSGQNAKLLDFPLYPFTKTEHRRPARPAPTPSTGIVSTKSTQSFITARGKNNSALPKTYAVNSLISSLVEGHRVAGSLLCPASVYIELAAQAATDTRVPTAELSLSSIIFSTPLVADKHTPLQQIEVRLECSSHGLGFIDFLVTADSEQNTGRSSNSFCSGRVSKKLAKVPSKPESLGGVAHLGVSNVIRRKMLYETIFTRVVTYTPLYQTIDWLQISNDGHKAQGSFRLRHEAVLKSCVTQPVFVDTLLHAAGFLANCVVSSEDVCICTKIEHVYIASFQGDWSESFELFTRIVPNKAGFVGTSHAFDSQGKLVAVIEGVEFRKILLQSFQKSVKRAGKRGHDGKASPKLVPITPQPNSTDDIRFKILCILQRITGIDEVKKFDDMTFTELGVDSLMRIELLETLRHSFPYVNQIAEFALLECEALHTLQELVESTFGRTSFKGFNLLEQAPGSSNDDNSTGEENRSESSFGLSDRESLLATSLFPSKCPTPDGRGSTPEPDVARVVCQIAAEIVGLPESKINLNSRLDNLGIDSLMSIELLGSLNSRTFWNRNLEVLESCRTVGDIVALAKCQPAEAKTARYPSSLHIPHLLKSGPDTAAPLYLIHDGSGTSTMYSRLDDMGRSVYGISVDTSRIFETLSEMANSYIEMIDSSRPFILGGWSFGGVVAFEMAKAIYSYSPDTLQGLILIDSPCPVSHEGLPSQVLEGLSENKPGWILENFRRHTALLQKHQPLSEELNIPVVFLKCNELIDTHSLYGARSAFLGDALARAMEVQRWEKLINQPILTLDIPGNHFQCFESSHVRETSQKLLEAIGLLIKTR